MRRHGRWWNNQHAKRIATKHMKYKRHDMHGIVIVDKPIGLSSMDVVRRVRRAAGHCKTGHAGTLDPLATGVVVCCLGKATKQISTYMDTTKVYDTVVDLSAFTNTDDREGEREEIKVANENRPDEAAIRAALDQLTGEIDQVPPMYSAIHVNGQRAYKLARKGEHVEIEPRRVQIHQIDLLACDWPNVTLKITCGKGVYIRSLGRDLGKLLNTGGHLASLRRTAVGQFTLEHAHPIERFEHPLEPEHLIQVADV